VPLYCACFKISTRPMRLIERFFILASVWAKTRCSRTRRPLIDGCRRICSGDSERLYLARAKGTITKYKKALGDPVGLAELLVFSCERAAGFCQDVHHEDTAYFDALVRMFEQALEATANLTGKMVFLHDSIASGVLVVNSVMELARTWMFCFPSSIYLLTPGGLHGNRN
jgi:hypothetical protein